MKKICEIAVAVLTLSLLAVPAAMAAGQTSAKPATKAAPVHPWVSFNPGAWVRIKSTTVEETAGKKKTTIVETKITLLEKTADKVVLQTDMTTADGQTTTTKAEFPVQGYTDAVPPGVKVLKKGSETVTIGDKAVTCQTLETLLNAGGTMIQSKTWTSAQVPGSLVKNVSTSPGSQSTAEVVDFKAS